MIAKGSRTRRLRLARGLSETPFHCQLERIPDARAAHNSDSVQWRGRVVVRRRPRQSRDKVSPGPARSALQPGADRWRPPSRLPRRRLSHTHSNGRTVIDSKPVVILGHGRVRYGVIRIDGRRLVITNDCLREALFRELVPVRTSAQISLVRLRIVRCRAWPAAISRPRSGAARWLRRRAKRSCLRASDTSVKFSSNCPAHAVVPSLTSSNCKVTRMRSPECLNAPVEHEGDPKFPSRLQGIGFSAVTKDAARRPHRKPLN